VLQITRQETPMVEPVNVAEYMTRPSGGTPDKFESVKVRVDGAVARMTLTVRAQSSK